MAYDPTAIIISFVTGGIGGGVAGAVVANWLAEGREAYAREYASALAKETRVPGRAAI